MVNPLSNPQMQSNSSSAMENFQRLASMLRSAKNPDLLISSLAQQNPQANAVMQMCRGKNPKDVFIAECKNRGLNPDEVISSLGLK